MATCLAYLSFDAFDKDYCHSDKEMEEFLENNTLYAYAAQFWGQHACREAEDTSKEMVLSLARNTRKLICATQVLFDPAWSFYGSRSRSTMDFSAVHLFSYLGLSGILCSLIEEGADAAKADGNGWTPLHYAAHEGHEATVRLLMQQRHVDINSGDSINQTPLSMAAENGHEAVVRLLISHDEIDLDSKDLKHRSPFSLAVRNRDEAVMRLLLQQENVEVNLLSMVDALSLSVVAERGHAGLMKLTITDERVDVNTRGSFDKTSLFIPVSDGDINVVELQLARQDFDVAMTDRTWYKSLFALVEAYGGYLMETLPRTT